MVVETEKLPVVILCGGLGTRMKEETEYRPKPMANVGNKPMIWHIMKIYSYYGFNDFILCLGYKGEMIKKYFYDYEIFNNDFTVQLGQNKKNITIHNNHGENGWKITLVDTGESAKKGARLKKIEKYINTDNFMVTYGDGVANININNLLEFHKKCKKTATITGVLPPSRFGTLSVIDDQVVEFSEKPQAKKGLINGGFFVFNKRILNYLNTDNSCDLEIGLLDRLSKEGELVVYRHAGDWMCMDTIRDLEYLNKLWYTGNPFWDLGKHE